MTVEQMTEEGEPTEAEITRYELQDAMTLIWVAHRTIGASADDITPCMQEVMDDLERAANHLHQEVHDASDGESLARIH